MSKSGYITLITLLIIIALAVAYYFYVQKQNETEALNNSPVAQALLGADGASYTDLEGNPVSLDDYIGSDLLAFAWASWCPSCGDQLSLLAKVANENENLSVLAFNRAEPIPTAQSYLQFYGLTDTVELIMDPTDHFFNSVDGYAMPETIIFNELGDIVHHERGEITETELIYTLQELDIITSQN